MGFWGSSLYANDCSCDIRDTYCELLQEQLSDKEAYEKTLELHSEYIGTEEEPLLWYALADIQWQYGRLMPQVKEKALKWIELSGGMCFWEESKSKGYGWSKTLEKLKSRLQSPMPSKKKINPKRQFVSNPWAVGDIYAYQFHLNSSKKYNQFGKYIVFQKLSDEEWFNNKLISRIQVYDKIFDSIPTLSDLENVRILPLDTPNRFLDKDYDNEFPLCLNAVIEIYKERDYPKKHLTFIGNKPDVFNMPFAHINLSQLFWCDVDDSLCYYYDSWVGYNYEVFYEKACSCHNNTKDSLGTHKTMITQVTAPCVE